MIENACFIQIAKFPDLPLFGWLAGMQIVDIFAFTECHIGGIQLFVRISIILFATFLAAN